MKITGVITEYNPFHLGHSLHLQKAKEDTNAEGIIAIMSGNFIQRGGPSLIDKSNRAIIAVQNGVDLVIELPLIYSLSSAEGFALGAVKILDATKVVDSLYFGSECGELSDLITISDSLNSESDFLKASLKDSLSEGLPFHKARESAISKVHPTINVKDILSNSNNILSIEYLKALKKINSNITPYTLKRMGANYNEGELKTSFPSATSIRKCLYENMDLSLLKSSLPNETYNILSSLTKDKYKFVFSEDMFKYLKYKLLTQGSSLSNISDINEGLDYKILKEIVYSNSFNELVIRVKSKRYTYTKISRILTSFFIGLENYPTSTLKNEEPKYIRPLAFNEKGSKILKEIKKKGNINIITKLPKKLSDSTLELDLLGTRAYSLLNPAISPMEDYLKSPILIK